MLTRIGCALGLAVLAVAAGRAVAGPDWVEHNEAGSTLPTAEPTIGVGSINTISGTLNGGELVPDFEDMYLIRILDPLNFSMSVISANFDAQLFLFNVTLPGEAFGLLANDNGPNSNMPFLTSLATDGTGSKVSFAGVYAVAISASGRVPVSRTGPIFFFANPTEISGPDGIGGINPHEDWTGPGVGGSYAISCTGVGFYETPAPGTGAVLAVGGLLAARRRRR
jgi:uncharacterized protein (TIGR03382 family)